MKSVRGFTLVELLVVISIIAVLSVIGITVFTGVQKGARDARRRADIDSIAKAFEVNKTPTYYNVLRDSMFSSGQVPKDPLSPNREYCWALLDTGDSREVDLPIPPWDPLTGCPTEVLVSNMIRGKEGPYIDTSFTRWTICALLESNSTYCTVNQQ